MNQREVTIPKELREKRNTVINELIELDNDPELLKRDIEFYKRVSLLSLKDLLQQFTI